MGAWAGRVALEGPADPLVGDDVATYEVVDGTVSRSQGVFANAEWALAPVARNELSGVVTSVDHRDGTVAAGAVLFRVDLRPVVVASGETPSFREMATGAVGPDVAQLQALLAELGFYAGRVTGQFDATLARSVRNWQKALGVVETGTVPLGEVLFVPRLPARLVVADSIAVGARTTPGEVAVQEVGDQPEFTVPLLPEQQGFAVLDAEVVLRPEDDLMWRATVTGTSEGADGGLTLTLAGIEGASVCGEQCDFVPVGERTSMQARVILVAPRQGPIVPVAALLTAPDGSTSVVMAGGDRRAVVILASADGLAVVDGLVAGEIVRIGGFPVEE